MLAIRSQIGEGAIRTKRGGTDGEQGTGGYWPLSRGSVGGYCRGRLSVNDRGTTDMGDLFRVASGFVSHRGCATHGHVSGRVYEGCNTACLWI